MGRAPERVPAFLLGAPGGCTSPTVIDKKILSAYNNNNTDSHGKTVERRRQMAKNMEKAEKEETRDRSTVRSIEKALNILRLFTYRENELSHTEISRRMGWTTSTTSRLLNTLVESGFLMKDPEHGRYRLGSAILYLGSVAASSTDLRRICIPVLRDLSSRTGETAHVYIRSGLWRICYEQVESQQAVRQASEVGSREPLWIGATGRALLAFLEDEERERLLEQIGRENPEVDMARLREQLAEERQQGYVENADGRNSHVGCIAAPVRNAAGKLEACLAVSMPSFRFPKDRREMRQAVLEGAEGISRQLGYSGGLA